MNINEDLDSNDDDVDIYQDQMRSKEAILKAEELAYNQVWYTRHKNWRFKVDQGRIKVVEKESLEQQFAQTELTVSRELWEAAIKAANFVEQEIGIENLGPWTDFEWGMINGKLSALRWVLGDEWDNLDS